jgi:hypothetical protein
MRVFHAGKRRLPAWTRPQLADNAFTERAPKSRIGLSRGDVGQLSVERWGRYKAGRQAYEHAIVASAEPGAKPLSLQPVIDLVDKTQGAWERSR